MLLIRMRVMMIMMMIFYDCFGLWFGLVSWGRGIMMNIMEWNGSAKGASLLSILLCALMMEMDGVLNNNIFLAREF